jgi:arylformamidase
MLIDISVRLEPEMTTWPDSVGVRVERIKSFANGDAVNVTRLDMDVHCGTHVEAPLHFLDGGCALEELTVDTFVGPAYVAHLPDADVIGPDELERAEIPDGTVRLLLRTRNSITWHDADRRFRADYAALSAGGAEWVVARGMRLIGVDYLSVQRFDEGPDAHQILMRGEVAILEGVDLSNVPAGPYRLLCAPIWIGGAEAAPARALLESME